jgi:hypothetical protein
MKRLLPTAAFGLLMLALPHLATAGPSPAVVSATTVLSKSTRIGVNMDAQSQYDGQAYLQNFLDNPGFEPAMLGHLIIVGSSSTSSGFTDTNDGNAFSSNLWNGVTASVRTGVYAGHTFTIAKYTAGGTYACASACPSLAAGDLIGETISNTAISYSSGHYLPGNWGVEDSDTGIALSTVKHYAGASSLLFDVHDGNRHAVEFGMDNFNASVGTCAKDSVTFCQTKSDCGTGTCDKAPTYPWHPVSGPMSMSAYALASGTTGTPMLTLLLARVGSSWDKVSHTFNLTQDGAWHQYVYNFTGADKSSDTGELIFKVTAQSGSAAGAKVYVDNAFLGPAASPMVAAWRNDVLTTLRTLNPGTLRYMNGQGLSSNDSYFEGNDYVRGSATDGTGGNSTWAFSLSDMYAMAGALGANPWISIPDLFSDADVNSFAANLCTAFAADGFSKAFVEQSNEDWASGPITAGGGQCVNYGKMANRNFGLIKTYMTSKCSTYASNVYFVVGGQEGNSGVLAATSAQIPTNDPHYGGTIAAYVPAQPEQNTGQTMAQYAALGFSNSLLQFATSGVGAFTKAVPNNITGGVCGGTLRGCNQFLAVYENGSSNQCGTATPIEAWDMSAGWIAAGFNGQNWILGFSAGSNGPNSGTLFPALAQNTFNLAQPEFLTSSGGCTSGHGTDTALWGIVHDFDSTFGPTFPHIRPIGWAEALLNRAIGGAYHQIDTLAWTGIYGAAFLQNGFWSVILSNSNNAGISFKVTFPPGGALPAVGETVLYTNGPADNDENSNSVKIGPLPGGVSNSGNMLTLTLPPLSVVALLPQATPAQR